MTDCTNNLHSFRTNKTLQKKGVEKGCCRECRSSLVDWERIYKKDITDFDYLRDAFKLEMIRNVFWTIKQPDEKMKKYIHDKSPEQLEELVHKRLKTTLSKPKKENDWDGRQTPFDGNLINWAQHATGTCCRQCLEEWYGIGANSEISDSDYAYLGQVILQYISEKME
ncbi:hypothetical protein SDC9_138096 [bioreactor metagenome]|uniref:DUF4186 domain-containing protein n=1 Tax=bioreactor metagenome TaxID=1076179 RepID=A0A645DR63_9ZZZZ